MENKELTELTSAINQLRKQLAAQPQPATYVGNPTDQLTSAIKKLSDDIYNLNVAVNNLKDEIKKGR